MQRLVMCRGELSCREQSCPSRCLLHCTATSASLPHRRHAHFDRRRRSCLYPPGSLLQRPNSRRGAPHPRPPLHWQRQHKRHHQRRVDRLEETHRQRSSWRATLRQKHTLQLYVHETSSHHLANVLSRQSRYDVHPLLNVNDTRSPRFLLGLGDSHFKDSLISLGRDAILICILGKRKAPVEFPKAPFRAIVALFLVLEFRLSLARNRQDTIWTDLQSMSCRYESGS